MIHVVETITSEGFLCRSISSLGALEEGSGWDLRVRPVPAPAASEKILDCEVGKSSFQTACLITSQKFQGVGLKLKALVLTFREQSFH